MSNYHAEVFNHFVSESTLGKPGLQSEIHIGHVETTQAIKKCSSGNLKQEERDTLSEAIMPFIGALTGAGLAIPEHLAHRVNGTVDLIDEYLPYVNVDAAVKNGDGRREWGEMVRAICGLSGKTNRSKVALDSKSDNWIVNGKAYFIDFFPPSLVDEDGQITPWVPDVYKRSRELFNFNYGDTRGQLTKLLAAAKINYGDQYEELKDITLDIARANLPKSITKYVEDQVDGGFPDMKQFYSVGGEVRLKELLTEK